MCARYNHTYQHFTFQYVSINTGAESGQTDAMESFTFQYVSINTPSGIAMDPALSFFTFQYVSINTFGDEIALFIVFWLYIPICFY